jgi:hypothetical protein
MANDEEEQENYFNAVFCPNIDYLKTLIRKCDRSIPNEYLFDDYKYTFSNYVNTVERVFDYIQTNEADDLNLTNIVLGVYRKMWYGFVLGNRILPNGHDEFYEPLLQEWEEKYHRNTDILTCYIENYNDTVFNIVKDNINYSYKYRSIIESIVDDYTSK